MNELEQLRFRVAGLTRQVEILTDRVNECERAGAGDRQVLVEWCRLNRITLAEALGPQRNRAIRALRDALSASRVGRVFGISGRQVQRIAKEKGQR